MKTKWIDRQELEKRGIEIIERAKDTLSAKGDLRKKLSGRFDEETARFIDYWFLPETQLELLSLILAIEKLTEHPFRDFFELVFSSAIIAKSGGVSLARDLAHSRQRSKRWGTSLQSLLRSFLTKRSHVCAVYAPGTGFSQRARIPRG